MGKRGQIIIGTNMKCHKALIVLFLIYQIKPNYSLDTEDVSWLVYITDKPARFPINTFDKKECTQPTDFQGCHGVVIRQDVALTTTSCLGPAKKRLDSLFVISNALDEHYFAEHSTKRVISAYFWTPPEVVCGDGGNECEQHRNLVLVRFQAFPLSEVVPLKIAPSNMQNPKNLECRIYGWAVWGRVDEGEKGISAYQMFSKQVKFDRADQCEESYTGVEKEEDIDPDGLDSFEDMKFIQNYCINNEAGDLCPYNAEAAPIVCKHGASDYLVGVTRKRTARERPVPIFVYNLDLYMIQAEEFANGDFDNKIEKSNPELSFPRGAANVAFITGKVILTIVGITLFV